VGFESGVTAGLDVDVDVRLHSGGLDLHAERTDRQASGVQDVDVDVERGRRGPTDAAAVLRDQAGQRVDGVGDLVGAARVRRVQRDTGHLRRLIGPLRVLERRVGDAVTVEIPGPGRG